MKELEEIAKQVPAGEAIWIQLLPTGLFVYYENEDGERSDINTEFGLQEDLEKALACSTRDLQEYRWTTTDTNPPNENT